MANYCVYILQNRKNSRYYVGSTSDVTKRLAKHNRGEVFSTRRLLPWILCRSIDCPDETSDKQSEYELKKYKRRDILEKVIKDGRFPWEYSSNKGL